MKSYILKMCRIKRAVAVMIMCLALMPALSSCTEKPTAEIEPSEEAAEKIEKWSYDGGDYLKASEKSEVVTVHADASGQVKETDVSVKLKGISQSGDGSGAVREISNLTDITNKNGDEEFEQKDEYIYFQNLGRDISYEGKSKAEIPVNLTVRYFLDGEEMSPAEIKGKKGHVRVSYRFENRVQKELEIGGSIRNAYASFAVITLVMPEKDTYSNLTTDDCELSSFESEEVIMALTMPGMKKNLEYLSADTSDADINESFAYEIDTESFEPAFSTSIVSTGLLDEEMDLSELDDLKCSLSDLKKAAGKLADAGSDVEEGMGEFENHLTKYTEGVDGLDGGAASLLKGIKKLDEEKSNIYDGSKGISDGISALNDAYAETEKNMLEQLDAMIEADPENEALKTFRDQYESGYTSLGEELKKASEASASYKDGVEEFNKGIGEIKKGAEGLKKGSGTLSSQGDKLLEGYGALKSGVSTYSDAVESFYDEGICKLYEEGISKINDLQNFVRMMEEADNIYDTYSGLDEGQTGSVSFIIETEKP